jgi:hypothetical protein
MFDGLMMSLLSGNDRPAFIYMGFATPAVVLQVSYCPALDAEMRMLSACIFVSVYGAGQFRYGLMYPFLFWEQHRMRRLLGVGRIRRKEMISGWTIDFLLSYFCLTQDMITFYASVFSSLLFLLASERAIDLSHFPSFGPGDCMIRKVRKGRGRKRQLAVFSCIMMTERIFGDTTQLI